VHTLHLPWNEPRDALLDHRVDVAMTRLPIRTDGLHITVLYDEPRMLLIPHGHRLAGKESVTLDDIADEPIPRLPDAAWNACWRIDPRPDGSPAPDGPLVNAVEDKLELIATGQAVAIVSAGLRADSLHPDVTTVSLDGVEPSHVVLATRANDRSRLVAAFRKYAQDCLTGPAPPSSHNRSGLREPTLRRSVFTTTQCCGYLSWPGRRAVMPWPAFPLPASTVVRECPVVRRFRPSRRIRATMVAKILR
jgi:hypothetical protein